MGTDGTMLETVVELSEAQRDAMKTVLGKMNLSDKTDAVEGLILGEATAAGILALIGHAWRVGWLVGQQATVEAHNREVAGR